MITACDVETGRALQMEDPSSNVRNDQNKRGLWTMLHMEKSNPKIYHKDNFLVWYNKRPKNNSYWMVLQSFDEERAYTDDTYEESIKRYLKRTPDDYRVTQVLQKGNNDPTSTVPAPTTVSLPAATPPANPTAPTTVSPVLLPAATRAADPVYPAATAPPATTAPIATLPLTSMTSTAPTIPTAATDPTCAGPSTASALLQATNAPKHQVSAIDNKTSGIEVYNKLINMTCAAYNEAYKEAREQNLTLKDILFGDSLVLMSATEAQALLDMLGNCNDEPWHTTSYELANLAQVFGEISLAESKKTFTYATSAQCKSGCKSELYVKPLQLRHWLTIAKARNYGFFRVCVHGTKEEAFKGIRNDPCGLDMQFGGSSNALAYGDGHYFGLSIETTHTFNKCKEGTFLLVLVSTKRTIHEISDSRDKRTNSSYIGRYGSYDTYHLSADPNADRNIPNALVAREHCIVLVLGRVEPVSVVDRG